jgi:SAM-dependent MidA family methyltransferase
MLIFILAVVTVIHDYKHGTMPFQKQREFLREQGLSLKKSDIKRNTQNKQTADSHSGMKRVKKRNTTEDK